ncbi:methyltransferase domain-containing protein [Inquilinus sp. CAU 1745]|uniref:class I SAM-dependent DNA methyltransferase n=1 Tax=Inquilinus sp. CAU 1745 TaxID=3140369 RepID=UPI00325A4D68
MGSFSLAAQRRLEIGLALLDGDAPADAADAFRAALEEAPDYPDAWFSLGHACEASCDPDGAAEAYRRYRALDPGDAMGAGVRLALLGAEATPDRLPAAYVRALFDQYAPRFDRALTERLGYRAPALLREAVLADRRPDDPPLSILDLGCGTGLGGAAFRDLAVWLEGVDLSPGMVARARMRGLYDALEVEDIETALDRAERRYDLVLAADVLAYLGDLGTVFRQARRVLMPDGLFAFTVERTDEPGFRLGEKHRYAHNDLYVAAQAAVAGFEVARMSLDWSRTEAGAPVPGLVVVLCAAAEIGMDDVVIAPPPETGRGRLDA